MSEKEATALSFRLLAQVHKNDELCFLELLEKHGFSSVTDVTDATDAFFFDRGMMVRIVKNKR